MRYMPIVKVDKVEEEGEVMVLSLEEVEEVLQMEET